MQLKSVLAYCTLTSFGLVACGQQVTPKKEQPKATTGSPTDTVVDTTPQQPPPVEEEAAPKPKPKPGSTGSTGSTGNTGSTSSTGSTGGTGGTGGTGHTGGTGSTGNTGSTGSTGSTSGTGSTGHTGSTGSSGSTGSTGSSSSVQQACDDSCDVIAQCDQSYTGTAQQCATDCVDYADAATQYTAECGVKNHALDVCIAGISTCSEYNDTQDPACYTESVEYQVECGGRETTCDSYCTTLSGCATNVDYNDCMTACQDSLRDEEAKGVDCTVSIYPLFNCLGGLTCSDLADYYDTSIVSGYPCEAEDQDAYNYCP